MKSLPILGISRFVGVQILFALFLLSGFKVSAYTPAIDKDPDVIGRWDITINKDGKSCLRG
jgi:hypothetical protein